MSFNDFDSSAAERNPWVDEDTRAIENVLLVCQKTGHVTHTLVNTKSCPDGTFRHNNRPTSKNIMTFALRLSCILEPFQKAYSSDPQ